MPEMRYDAQATLTYLIAQASLIESQVYQIQYGDIMYPRIVPIDTSAPEYIRSVTYFSSDGVGQAQWINGQAHDIPRADILRNKQETRVHMAGIGYGYDLDEVGYCALLGIPIENDKAMMARRAAEEFIDNVVQTGNAPDGTNTGYYGLINNPTVTSSVAPADGTSGSTSFNSKTSDKVIRDLNGMISGVATNTLRIELADTLLIPFSVWDYLSSTPYITNTNETILSFFLKTNVYTVQTGNPLTVMGVLRLETAGAGNTRRVVAYRCDPTVVKCHIPMPFKFFPVWQNGPLRFEVPGALRLGGVDIRRPAAFRYLDGV